MEKAEYELMYRIETSYWWFMGRRWLSMKILSRILKGTGLAGADIGCGTGGNIITTSHLGTMTGCDIAPEAVEFCRERGIEAVLQTEPDRLPFADARFDFLTVFDVLEHIENDRGMIDQFARVLKPGGLVILTVPAYPSLWSVHDESLHHVRRYGRKELGDKVRDAGLEIVKLTHLNLFLLPLIMPVRWLRDRVTRNKGATSDFNLNLPGWMNLCFKAIFCSEWAILRFMPLPAGLSLLCVARKKP